MIFGGAPKSNLISWRFLLQFLLYYENDLNMVDIEMIGNTKVFKYDNFYSRKK